MCVCGGGRGGGGGNLLSDSAIIVFAAGQMSRCMFSNAELNVEPIARYSKCVLF